MSFMIYSRNDIFVLVLTIKNKFMENTINFRIKDIFNVQGLSI